VSEDISNFRRDTQAEASTVADDLAGGENVSPETSERPSVAHKHADGHADGYKLNGAHEPASALEPDGVAPGETGPDEAGADSADSRADLRADAPCTDMAGVGDAPSAEAHAEARERIDAQIMTLYDVPPLDLEFDFDEAYRHLEVIGRANGRVLLQTFDNNKPRLKQVNEIAKDWNAVERKLAKKENRYPDLIGDPLAKLSYGTLDQFENGLMNIQRRGAGVYIPFNLMRGKRRVISEVKHICGAFRENDTGGGPLPIEPTMTLATSPGKSHDWLLADEPWARGELGTEDWRAVAEEFTGMMRRMIADHGSDPDAKDLTRVLRLAGFNNLKDPDHPFLVEIVNVSGTRYARGDLVKAFPPISSSSGGDRKKKANGAANGADATAFSGNAYTGDGSRPYTKRKELELRSAIKFVRVDTREAWVAKCFAFLRLGWPDEIAFDIFHELCARSKGYVSYQDCLALWEDCKKYLGDTRGFNCTIDKVFGEAKDNGWKYPFTDEDFAKIAKLEDADDIEKFNADFALIEDPVCIARVTTGKLLLQERFLLLTGNRWARSGKRATLVATKWIGSTEQRRHKGIVFDPGQPRVTRDNSFNIWEGFKVRPIAGDAEPFVKLAEHVSNNDPEKTKYILQWMAHLLQRPHVKMFTVPYNYVKMTGVGKSLLVEKFGELLGDYFKVVRRKEIQGTTNTYLYSSLLVYIDEALFTDKKELAALLKALITQKRTRIKEVYQPIIDVETFANFWFSSNDKDGLPIEGHDRRYYVIPAPSFRLDQAFYDQFDEKVPTSWWNTGGKEAVMHLLMSYDLTGFDPHAPAPMTEEKRTLIDLSRNPNERRAAEILEQYEGSTEPLQRVEDLVSRADYSNLEAYNKDVTYIQNNLGNLGAARKRPRIDKEVTDAELQLWPARKKKDGQPKSYEPCDRITLLALTDSDRWSKDSEGDWAKQFRWQQVRAALEQARRDASTNAQYTPDLTRKREAPKRIELLEPIFAQLEADRRAGDEG
jgi:hypothetical protein